MRNKSYLNLFLILGLSLTGLLPWACTKSISVPLSPGSSLTSTPTSTAALLATNTPTATGSQTNTPTSTVTNTPSNTFTPTVTYTPTFPVTSANFIMSSGTTMVQSGTYVFNTVNISGSALVTLGGGVTLLAQSFTLGRGATIRGLGYWSSVSDTTSDVTFCAANGIPVTYNSYGQPSNYGPGTGGSAMSSSGYTSSGAGHGGAGGYGFLLPSYHYDYTSVVKGGPANDDPVHPVLMGSGGGEPLGGGTCLGNYNNFAPAGWGGGLIWIVVYNPTTNQVAPAVINGTIDMDGILGCSSCGCALEPGAGGAGGSILIEASTITGTGLLTANGVGSMGGTSIMAIGNSGGGIISLIENLTTFSGTTSVLESNNGIYTDYGVSSNGVNGSVTFTAAPASGY